MDLRTKRRAARQRARVDCCATGRGPQSCAHSPAQLYGTVQASTGAPHLWQFELVGVGACSGRMPRDHKPARQDGRAPRHQQVPARRAAAHIAGTGACTCSPRGPSPLGGPGGEAGPHRFDVCPDNGACRLEMINCLPDEPISSGTQPIPCCDLVPSPGAVPQAPQPLPTVGSCPREGKSASTSAPCWQGPAAGATYCRNGRTARRSKAEQGQPTGGAWQTGAAHRFGAYGLQCNRCAAGESRALQCNALQVCTHSQ